MYYALFNNEGERLTTYVPGINCEIPPAGAILISEEDQNLYATNEYIRDNVTGQPIKKPPYVPTLEEIQERLTAAIQEYMDNIARERGYDNLLSAVTYADEPIVPSFQVEGIAFRAWRSAVWDYCYTQLDAVLNGEREIPSVNELIAELPTLNL